MTAADPAIATADGLMTFRQASGWLGLGKTRAAGRALERRVLAKERKLKRELIVRLAGPERENRRVTRSMFRTHFHELLPSKVKQMRRDVSSQLQAIDEYVRAASQAFVAQHVEPRLDELWERDEEIAETVNELSRRVTLLTKTAEAHRGPQVRTKG